MSIFQFREKRKDDRRVSNAVGYAETIFIVQYASFSGDVEVTVIESSVDGFDAEGEATSTGVYELTFTTPVVASSDWLIYDPSGHNVGITRVSNTVWQLSVLSDAGAAVDTEARIHVVLRKYDA